MRIKIFYNFAVCFLLVKIEAMEMQGNKKGNNVDWWEQAGKKKEYKQYNSVYNL